VGVTTGIELIQKVEYVLNDEYGEDYDKRWSRAELLEWLNDGQRDIVVKVPLANARIVNVQLVAGPQQQLSAAYYRILGPVCNMGTGGSTYGAPITTTTLQALSGMDSAWLTATASAEVSHVVPSETLRDFFTYPPVATGGTYVKLQLSKVPSTMEDTNDAIEIEEAYATALKYYMLQMAFSKDADVNPTAARAGMFMNMYLQALGIAPPGGK